MPAARKVQALPMNNIDRSIEMTKRDTIKQQQHQGNMNIKQTEHGPKHGRIGSCANIL